MMNPFHYDHHNQSREPGRFALRCWTSCYNPRTERTIELVILCDSEAERASLARKMESADWGEWDHKASGHFNWLFYAQYVAAPFHVRDALRDGMTLKGIISDIDEQMEALGTTRTGPRARIFGLL